MLSLLLRWAGSKTGRAGSSLPRSQCVIFWTFMAAGTSAPHARPPRCASAPRLAEEDNRHDGVYGVTTTGQRLIMVSRTESTGSAPRATRDRVVVSAYPARLLLTLVKGGS